MLQFFKDNNKFNDIKNLLSVTHNNILGYLIKKEKSNLLSIDIGSSYIKAVEISKKEGKLILEKFYVVPLPVGCIEGHLIKNRENLVKILKEFITENNYKGKDTALVIAGPQIVTQVIRVSDKFADNQLLTHIELEAEKYLPFDVDDLCMDFDVLKTGEQEQGYLNILLAAGKKAYINEYINLLEEVGLNLKVIDVYSCVMARLATHVVASQLQENIQNKVIAMLDIGHESLCLSMFKNDRQIYLKEQSLGGKDLSNLVMSEHHIGYEQAQELKLKYEDPMIANIVDKFRDKIIKQINHMLQFFYASAFGDKIDYLFICGGVANLPGLSTALEEQVKLPTYILDPFKFIDIDSDILNSDKFNKDILSAKLSAACGLGLRSYVE